MFCWKEVLLLYFFNAVSTMNKIPFSSIVFGRKQISHRQTSHSCQIKARIRHLHGWTWEIFSHLLQEQHLNYIKHAQSPLSDKINRSVKGAVEIIDASEQLKPSYYHYYFLPSVKMPRPPPPLVFIPPHSFIRAESLRLALSLPVQQSIRLFRIVGQSDGHTTKRGVG